MHRLGGGSVVVVGHRFRKKFLRGFWAGPGDGQTEKIEVKLPLSGPTNPKHSGLWPDTWSRQSAFQDRRASGPGLQRIPRSLVAPPKGWPSDMIYHRIYTWLYIVSRVLYIIYLIVYLYIYKFVYIYIYIHYVVLVSLIVYYPPRKCKNIVSNMLIYTESYTESHRNIQNINI